MQCLLRCAVGGCQGVGTHWLPWSRLAGLPAPAPWLRPGPEPWLKPPVRTYAAPAGFKVTICGAAGCTGQPLALLLKQCPLIDELALYDSFATCGMGVELSHVDTKPKVCAYSGRHMICDALKDASLVVIVAKDRVKNSFDCNAPIVAEIALQICNTCPTCFTIVATEPVECMTVIVAEIQRLRGCYNPRKTIGCVELNCVRANTVLADFLRVPPESVEVPVIAGCTYLTMVPVLSAACHPGNMSQEQVECVTSCIMGGTEAVCRSMGKCTAIPCLAGAFAIARTAISVVKGIQGAKTTQCCYLDSLGTCVPDCQFFACNGLLGPSGVERVMGVPELTKFEHCLLCNALPIIRNEQARAVWLVYKMCETGLKAYPCYSPPKPCRPPCKWAGCTFDEARDEYLAKVCRKMTCRCGSTQLCWTPRKTDYDSARASNLQHQLPAPCPNFSIPRSVAMQKCLQERAKDPFPS